MADSDTAAASANSNVLTSEEESIGYGRPPKRSQFKKGQSGNPKGRPRGSKNLSTLLEDEMNQTVTITENGTRKRVSKKQAIAKRVVNGAIAGDPKMVPILLGRAASKGDAETGAAPIDAPLSAEDDLVIRDLIGRLRSAEPLPQSVQPPAETGASGETGPSPSANEGEP